MNLYKSRAPLRLGLAGGGTDVSPYCDLYGGCVLNATIDRYAYATIKVINEPYVRFISSDQQISEENRISDREELRGNLVLHKAVYSHMIEIYNAGRPIPMELTTFCDAPVGSGLGTSSTLVVAMIRVFAEMMNLPLDDYFIAQLAYKIERFDCGLQGGRQDQYSAAFGGFNFMEFYANDRAVINPLRIKNWIINELESSLILYFTGISRESAKIIADQSSNVTAQSADTIKAMDGLKKEAFSMKECLLKGDFVGIIDSMKTGWENKKMTASTVSNIFIDRLYDEVINAGAACGKVSGAGGGGFMLFFVPSDRKSNVISVLNKYPGQISNCHFTKHGSQSWRS
jgi:D-glycero-alpha-D-manno-heptose-7-phosphate kinase